jgi:hypothetical protein
MLPKETSFSIRVFSGKQDLLSKLPTRLQGYRKWLPDDWRLVILVDKDREDCLVLKATLEKTAHQAGFVTKSSAKGKNNFDIINRLAIEELEAWFFGDTEALVQAYPRVPATIGKKAKYRDPDSIAGGTWEALERILKKSGYYSSGMPKVEIARNISAHMDLHRNCSRSFQVFRDALLEIKP